MFYLALPYILLAALTAGYLLYRRRRTGRVVLKVRRILFSRANLELLLSAALVCLICALFLWSDLRKLHEIATAAGAAGEGRWLYWSRIAFYPLLAVVFTARQLERPALREGGISSPRWFWTWEQIRFYRWRGALLQFHIRTGRREIIESWAVAPDQKEELDRLLKQKTKRMDKKSRGKRGSRR
ncbi:MAG: hypothetical protein GX890_01960 [Firmicutes bacterium]|nr:hypothetical protein [Bacillota bacterium]